MKTIFALVAVGIAVGYFLIHRNSPERLDELYAEHFEAPLPAGCELLQHTVASSGFEPVHGFAFAAPDRKLFEQVASEWRCTPAHKKMSVIVNDPPWWWITRSRWDELDLSDSIGRQDRQTERYWTVIYDPDEGRVYAECGKM